MTFLWPSLLWTLVALPPLVAAYAWLLRRRRAAVAYSDLGLVRAAIGGRASWRRHVPPALLLVALAVALVAAARPTAVVALPSQLQTIVLAVDVSLSMKADDVQPTRLSAAQSAARSFVEAPPPHTRIGVVAFGGSAQLVQKPTSSATELVAAIERFELQRATATGSGIAVALAALFPEASEDIESQLGPVVRGGARAGTPVGRPPAAATGRPPPVRPGSYPHGVIVLLSDGRRTVGPDPLAVARLAADRGVRVFTVGFGTVKGTTIGFDGWSAFVQLDEETLKQVAELTRGEYFHADTASDLKAIYRELNTRFVVERKDTEVTALLAATAAALLVLAGGLSLAWFGRAA